MFKIQCIHDTTEFPEDFQTRTEKKWIAIVWPFVCNSFADLCISFDGKKNKEIDARNVCVYIVVVYFSDLWIYFLKQLNKNISPSLRSLSHFRHVNFTHPKPQSYIITLTFL